MTPLAELECVGGPVDGHRVAYEGRELCVAELLSPGFRDTPPGPGVVESIEHTYRAAMDPRSGRWFYFHVPSA